MPDKEKGPGPLYDAHPEEYKEWAYQLWAFVCGRTMDAVADRLAHPVEGDVWPAREIALQTLYRWSYGNKSRLPWKKRLHEDLRQIAPDMHRSVMANLLFASDKFSQWVNDVANDRVPMETGLQINAVRAKTDVAKLAFDRAGFVAFQMNPGRTEPVAPPSREEEAPLAALGEGGLMDQWYKVLSRVEEKELVTVDGDDS